MTDGSQRLRRRKGKKLKDEKLRYLKIDRVNGIFKNHLKLWNDLMERQKINEKIVILA